MISGITSDKRVKSFGIVWADTRLAQQKTIRQKRPEQYLMFLKAAVMLLLIMDMILVVFKFLLSTRKDSFFCRSLCNNCVPIILVQCKTLV